MANGSCSNSRGGNSKACRWSCTPGAARGPLVPAFTLMGFLTSLRQEGQKERGASECARLIWRLPFASWPTRISSHSKAVYVSCLPDFDRISFYDVLLGSSSPYTAPHADAI